MIPRRDAMQGSAKALQHRPALAGLLLEAFSPQRRARILCWAKSANRTQCCRIAPSEARRPRYGHSCIAVNPYRGDSRADDI